MRRRWQLQSLERRDVPSTYTEVEPNDAYAAANAVVVPVGNIVQAAPDDWLTVIAGLSSGTDRDCFQVTLGAPATLFLDIDCRDSGLSDILDTVVDVLNGSGTTVLAGNDDSYDFDTFRAPISPVLAATIPDPSLSVRLSAGTYIVRVTSFGEETLGSYQLRMFADAGVAPNAPALSSLPGAPFVVLCDFDGASATDSWGNYVAAPFDLDGSSGTFSAEERLAVNRIFRIVAEDFSAFRVNVTTVEPASPQPAMVRVVFTSSSGLIVGRPASSRGAGVLNSLAGPESDVVFVFQPGFGDYQGGISGRIVAAGLEQGNEASQQLGTALGLRHYGGVNSQPLAVMQFPEAGLNRATWTSGLTHSGEPPVVTQYDTAVITSTANGIVPRPDDHGETLGTSSVLPAAGATGVIETVADRDLFSFSALAGNSALRVTADPYSGNGNFTLRVFGPTGLLLATSDPADGFDAALTLSLASGTYYAEVASHGGSGDLGQYSLTLAFNPVTGPLQVANPLVGGGSPQRSVVNDLTIGFNRLVSFPVGMANAFAVEGAAGAIPISVDELPNTTGQTSVRIRFPQPGGGFGSLPNGRYTLRATSAYILDFSGQPLDGDFNSLPGGDFVMPFHRLAGDATGDARVDAADFLAFRLSMLSTSPVFDFDLDGAVTSADFLRFRLIFLTSI
ncbi:MAG: DVUA0089 family protein [Gemmataceae bacterium]|nr:DVUA0089 family protein [Gemmataceae bacterium]